MIYCLRNKKVKIQVSSQSSWLIDSIVYIGIFFDSLSVLAGTSDIFSVEWFFIIVVGIVLSVLI